MRRLLAAVAAGLALAGPAAGQDDHPEREVAAAPRAGDLALDGRIDEAAWDAAAPLTGFLQREPDEGEPATERTEVRFLFDESNLYVGILAFDARPDAIVARILERDGLLGGIGGFGGGLLGIPDDAVGLVLDTFHDHRNSFLFVTNPLGSVNDALIESEGDANVDWDGVWEAAAVRTPEGWSAELAIPWTTLRFPPGEAQTWGVNLTRVIKRKSEEALWTSWGRDNGGLLKVSRAGHLEGLPDLEPAANVQVKPFALARSSAAENLEGVDEGTELDAGVDGKWGITPNLTLDWTVNTDFAQVEADREQINLTRFSLFFPEKREFFLENAGIFEFGAAGFGPPSLLLFFSRRIGIADGREIPLLGGARLTGRVGPWSVGALDVVTGEESDVSRTNWSVVRVRRNVGRRSQWGAIVTHTAPGEGDGAAAYGVDGVWRPTRRMEIGGFAARVSDPSDPDEPWGGRAYVDFTGDFWGWLVDWIAVGEGMRPPAGFVRRTGYHRGFGTLRQSPRPPGIVRRIDIRESAEIVVGTDGEVEDGSFSLSVSPELETGDGFQLQVSRRYERLEDPFELREELVVPPGEYRNTSWSASLETSAKRPLRFEAGWSEPGFFDGDRRQISGAVEWAPSPHLDLGLQWSRNEVETPHGELSTDLGILRVGIAPGTRLAVDALVQYNGDTDEVSANLRLDWIWSPGSDLFVVLNARRSDWGAVDAPETRALIVKATRLVRF